MLRNCKCGGTPKLKVVCIHLGDQFVQMPRIQIIGLCPRCGETILDNTYVTPEKAQKLADQVIESTKE